jgi:CRISPR-associated protein Cas2
MMVLITYDVNTQTGAGIKRLRKVAKACVNYGVRVQNSVFECILDAGQLRLLKDELEQLMDPEQDSIRIYRLGDNFRGKVEELGTNTQIQVDDVLLL